MGLRKAGIIAAASASLVVGTLAFPGAAMAAKGGNNNTSTDASITLNAPDGVRLADAGSWAPALGDWIDFTTVVPKGVSNPRVQIWCYQGEELVYAMADTNTASFELGGGSSEWRTNGLAASCKADLFEWKWLKTRHTEYVVYASTSFEASGRA